MQFWGLRTHNLKNLNVKLPHDKIIVIAGPSGSGKSSLAKDSLYAESLRSYVDSLGLPPSLLPKYEAEMDSAEGLMPTLCLDASKEQFQAHTRLGDLAEVHLWLRQLFSSYGKWHCPKCQLKLKAWSPQQAALDITKQFNDQRLRLCVPIPCQDHDADLAGFWQSQGYVRAWQNGAEIELSEWQKESVLWLVVDRIKVQSGGEERLAESLRAAWKLGPTCRAQATESHVDYYIQAFCGEHQFSGGDLRPYFWNAGHPSSACPSCRGQGCDICLGQGLKSDKYFVRFNQYSWLDFAQCNLNEAHQWISESLSQNPSPGAQRLGNECLRRLKALMDLGLDYLSLGRTSSSLSTGERQRARLAALLGQNLSGMCYVLDEVSAGLHPLDLDRLMQLLLKLKAKGNTLVLVDHHMQILQIADHIVEMGPKSGEQGGQILFQGTLGELTNTPQSQLLLNSKTQIQEPFKAQGFIELWGAKGRNLQVDHLQIALGCINLIHGVSGSGKSSLILDTLYPALLSFLQKESHTALQYDKVHCQQIQDVQWIEAGVHQGSKRSSPASLLGLLDDLRTLFAGLPESMTKGFKASFFSPNIKGGRCESCKGDGVLTSTMGPLGLCEEECPECLGRGFQQDVLKITFKGKNISEILELDLENAAEFFRNHPKIHVKLQAALDLGLGYLELGRSCLSLSSGEMQRLRLAKALLRPRNTPTLLILDEPSRGLFHLDLQRLRHCLRHLQDAGHTLIVIDHHPDLWSCADWTVEMGPAGGNQGGQLIYQGPRPSNFYH